MSQEDDDDLKLEKKSFWMSTPESRFQELIEKMIERVKGNDRESRQRDEEQQRRVDFIVEQQAQFAVGMEQLREVQARAEERWERTEEKWDRMWERTNGQINAVLAIAELQTQEIKGLAEAQANTNKQMAETTEKLDALINVVERIVSERQNGG